MSLALSVSLSLRLSYLSTYEKERRPNGGQTASHERKYLDILPYVIEERVSYRYLRLEKAVASRVSSIFDNIIY